VTASVHDVNERRLCKISEEVEKFFALTILFCGAAQIEERFLASPACGGQAGNGDSACE